MGTDGHDHQPERAVQLAVDLVNLGSPADGGGAPDAAALRRLLADHGEAEPFELGDGDAAAIAAVRAGLLAVFQAADVDAAAGLVNRLLQRAGAPRLSNHDGSAWHLHLTDERASWADWLAATTGLGLARLLAEDGTARLGCCAAPGCRLVFAGGPRNHVRRYCSPACATRARVAAFRARHQQAAGAGR